MNGVAQGPAAWNVPPSVYAVVDLYGQAAQATIMDDMGERGRLRHKGAFRMFTCIKQDAKTFYFRRNLSMSSPLSLHLVDLPPLPEDSSEGPTVLSPGSPCSIGGAITTTDLRFHQLHGTNAVITNGGRTALRQNCRSEFNDAIVISNRWVT